MPDPIHHGDFEIRRQMQRLKLFHKGRYVLAFNDCPWRPYLFPFLTPSGVNMLHESSADHPFHNGIFFAHRDIDGIDFWIPKWSPHQQYCSGRIICRSREWKLARDGVIRCDDTSDWLDAMAGQVIGQKTSYEIECRKSVIVLRISTILTARRALTFKQTKEALLGVRIADAFVVDNGAGRIVDADGGINEAGCMEKSAAWLDYQGTAAGHTAGLLLRQPTNRPRIPWFARDYGFVGVNQFRTGGELKLAEGETYALDVLIAAHDGDHMNPELREVIAS